MGRCALGSTEKSSENAGWEQLNMRMRRLADYCESCKLRASLERRKVLPGRVDRPPYEMLAERVAADPQILCLCSEIAGTDDLEAIGRVIHAVDEFLVRARADDEGWSRATHGVPVRGPSVVRGRIR